MELTRFNARAKPCRLETFSYNWPKMAGKPRTQGFRTAHKLIVGFCAGLALLAVLGIAVLIRLGQLDAIVRHLAVDPVPGSAAVASIATNFNQYRALQALGGAGAEPGPALARKAADIDRDLQLYEATITQSDDRRQFGGLMALWSTYRRLPDPARQSNVAGEIDTLLTNIIAWNREEGERSIEKADAAFRTARTTVLSMLLVASLMSALAFHFNRTIERPIGGLVDTVRSVAQGNPSVRAPVDGPIEIATVARELNEMLDARDRAEAEVRALNADLERRVQDRTAGLARVNQELENEISERKRVEETLRVKNDELKGFAYTASHDLKAPLRGISGYAQELQRRHATGLAERARFCLQQIVTASRNLDRLIDDLLQYARVDGETPNAAAFNLPAVVQSILRDRSGILAEHAVEVTTDLKVSTIYEWERGVSQVLANLIDNGIKYSRKATPPRVRIEAEDLTSTYRLTVRDNGIGFDMKYHDRIFGLFNRLVRQDEFEGTGAGLAIVKKLVDKRGGRIWAESQPGAGASFFVEFPK